MVFSFSFPIISPLILTLYRLVILPNRERQTIIPPSPFLAITGDVHVYIAAECPKVDTRYLCEEKLNHQLRNSRDCVCDIIEGQLSTNSCEKVTINLTRPAMEKLDDRHYAIAFPHATQTKLTCGREEFITLNGSYLATIPINCMLRTDEFTIINVNDRIEGQPMKITEIPTKLSNAEMKIPTLKTNTISLGKLHEIQEGFNHQKPTEIDDVSLYHTTIPLYSIVLAAVTLSIIVLIRRYLRSRQTVENETNRDNIYAVPHASPEGLKSEPSQDRRKLPATFSLNILK